MRLTEDVQCHLAETVRTLHGSDRRLFMARTVKLLGRGGQRRAEQVLGWNRHTLIKGMHELDSGIVCLDAFSQRGRLRAEERFPGLLEDIKAIVDSQSQTDPRFRTQRLYTRISAAVVRQQLLERKGYAEDEVPAVRTLSDKLNDLGYHPATVAKCRPKKRFGKRMRSSPACTK
jgi:predicted RNA-binding protein with EMAP domain